jgi:hypothetical protein
MRTAWCRSFALALGLLFVAAASVYGLTLVKDGQPTCVIVTADNPYPSQQLAAEELQYHLEQMSGAKVPIVREADLQETDAVLVFVGQSENLSALGIDTTSLPPETMIVKTKGNALILAGEDGGTKDPYKESYASSAVRTGTLYAVYDLLQDQLGCRWLWPGKSGEAIPQRKTVEIGELDIQETPQLFRRHFRGGYRVGPGTRPYDYVPRYIDSHAALRDRLDQEEWQWKKRLKMGQSVSFAYGHAFTDWMDKYENTLPEVLAMQADGHRGTHAVTYNRNYVKLCISNPKVIDIIVGEFMAKRAEDPSFRFLNACENDGSWGFCRCPQCAAWDKPFTDELYQKYLDLGWSDKQIDDTFAPSDKDNQPGSLSNRYFTFYNKLGARIAEIAPDALVVVYAYSRYRYAPFDLKVATNLLIGFVGFHFYPMDAGTHRAERQNYLAWREADAKQLFFRPNSFYYSFAHGIPWSAAHQMGEDIKLLIQNGIVATDYDTLNGHWATGAPTYYTVARLHWDPDMQVDDVLGEFCDAFGPGEASVKAYFDHWEEVFQEAYAHPDIRDRAKKVYEPGGWIGLFRYAGEVLSESDFDKGAELLTQAEVAIKREGNERQLAHLHVLDLGLKHGKLMWQISRIANATTQNDDVYYAESWPLMARLFAIRDELGELGAANVFWLNYFEVYFQDMFGTRVYQDFFDRDYVPVMTPAEANWTFSPDPKDIREEQGWTTQIPQPPAYMKRSSGDRLFHREWDKFNPVIVWKNTAKKEAVVNGWYQTDFDVPADRLQPTDVLYVPCILGTSAKIWVDGNLVREVTAEEIAANKPIVVGLAEAGIQPGRKFRLTVKVTSLDGPGGLIGPVYLARPKIDIRMRINLKGSATE